MRSYDIGGKRYWFTPIQFEVIRRLERQNVGRARMLTACKMTCRKVTEVDSTEPADQTAPVQTATAGMVGTGLGAEASGPDPEAPAKDSETPDLEVK
jgi:hypothetical protein